MTPVSMLSQSKKPPVPCIRGHDPISSFLISVPPHFMLASLSFAEYLVTNDNSARTSGPGVPSGDDVLVGLRSTDEADFAGEKRVPEDPRGPEGPPKRSAPNRRASTLRGGVFLVQVRDVAR